MWSRPKSAHHLRSHWLLPMIPDGSARKTCFPWGSYGPPSPTPGGRNHWSQVPLGPTLSMIYLIGPLTDDSEIWALPIMCFLLKMLVYLGIRSFTFDAKINVIQYFRKDRWPIMHVNVSSFWLLLAPNVFVNLDFRLSSSQPPGAATSCKH